MSSEKQHKGVRHAEDEQCSRCDKQADVFVGLADPDATQYPMCNDCAKQWRMDVMLRIYKLMNEEDR